MGWLEGIGISPGYAEGVAVVYEYETDYRLEFPDRDISASEIMAEHNKLDDAGAPPRTAAIEQSTGEKQPYRLSACCAHTHLVHDIAAQSRSI